MRQLFLLLFLPLYTTTFFAQSDIEQFLAKNQLTAQSKYGVHYIIQEQGQGATIQKGDYVQLHYLGKLFEGKTFDQTLTGEPFVFQVGYGQVIRGLDLGLTLFNKGSKGQLFIPADLAYGKNGVGKTIPPNTPLLFEIEVLDIMTPDQYDDYMIVLEQKERAAFEQHKKEQFQADLKQIHKYASAKKIKATRLPSGVSYAITKKGKGDFAKAGDQLQVRYEGYLIDGSQFDASPSKKPYTFELGSNKVIQGWEDALTKFNKGAEGWLLIPSKLAYGPRAIEEDAISIPANSILIFKIKVEHIQQEN